MRHAPSTSGRARAYTLRMNSKLSAALFCAAILVAVPSTANAARLATEAEKAAVSAVYETAPECSTVFVSERSNRYARWQFAISEGCQPTADGFGIARRDDAGLWRNVYQASEGSDACPTAPLPTEVGVELQACSRPSRHLYISISNFLNERALFKPRRLPHGAHSFLGRLRWRGWDRSVATASGFLDYSDRTESFRYPIRLRASRVRFCGARRIYDRLTLRFVRSADRRRVPHFEGPLPTNDECPG